MTQIMSVTDVRKNLSQLVRQVANGGKQIVIVTDSAPKAVLFPYEDFQRLEEASVKAWQTDFDVLLKAGKEAGKAWAKKEGINLDKLSEEEKYDLTAKM
ncbi:MAG: type II toxin-antitoxin system Phd/YefM family antitoxin [Patescibacteria group bacterium]